MPKKKTAKTKKRTPAKNRKGKTSVKAVAATSKRGKAAKPIGTVTHYFGGIGVMIARFSVAVATGTKIRVRGATTDFVQTIASMQYNHNPIARAKKRQEVGIKVKGHAREGDKIYRE
ncbi:MAG: hypothetical protein RIQ56_113 [Candidatus Parcubacteria bacterium]|jgi:putative protease